MVFGLRLNAATVLVVVGNGFDPLGWLGTGRYGDVGTDVYGLSGRSPKARKQADVVALIVQGLRTGGVATVGATANKDALTSRIEKSNSSFRHFVLDAIEDDVAVAYVTMMAPFHRTLRILSAIELNECYHVIVVATAVKCRRPCFLV